MSLSGSSTPKIKVTYFDIEAAAEKVRLALSVQGMAFEDDRIQFQQWGEMKPTIKFGQLPVMNVDGKDYHQSEAQLRWVGRQGDASLYPTDAEMAYEIDMVMGMHSDFARDWSPCIYVSMRPANYGYPEGDAWPAEEKDTTVKALRKKFLAEKMPLHMGYLADQIESCDNKFLCGDTLTIADLLWYPQLTYFKKGIADYVPVDCMDKYAVVNAWMDRVAAVPSIAEWYNKDP